MTSSPSNRWIAGPPVALWGPDVSATDRLTLAWSLHLRVYRALQSYSCVAPDPSPGERPPPRGHLTTRLLQAVVAGAAREILLEDPLAFRDEQIDGASKLAEILFRGGALNRLHVPFDQIAAALLAEEVPAAS